eukprot:2067439-Alexandrium_andersonii.AAC.1
MQAIVARGRTPRVIQWIFLGIADLFNYKILDKGQLSNNALTGGGANKKGLADLLITKLQMLDYILQTKLDDLNVRPEAKAGLRDHLASHSQYREYLVGVEDSSSNRKAPDVSWMK